MAEPEALRVLVVDDAAGARALCRKLLEQEGYLVTEAVDGLAALATIEHDPPHIIVMDALMPNMDGLECTRRIKADSATRDIPVIMASALSEATDIVAGLEAGADEYLTKPFRAKEFTLRVRSMARLQLGRMELLRSNEMRGEQARILTLLLDFCRELAVAKALDAILEKTLFVTAAVTFSRRVSIMLPDEDNRFLSIAKSLGIAPEIAAKVRVPIGEATAGQVFQSRQAVVINTAEEARARHHKYDSDIYASVPMISAALGSWGNVVGVLNVTDRLEQRPFATVELEYIDLISNIAASAIHDCTSRQARDDARDSVVVALASLAERRDVETGKHLDRVTCFSLMLGEELRSSDEYRAIIDDEFLRDLRRAVPLHDIGKVAVPDRILLKSGQFTPAEMAIMKTHPEIGAATIRSVVDRARGVRFLVMAEQVAHGHHEWYDGSGYPRGLKGGEIPLPARIVALADVYDALTTKRVYKDAFSHDRAVTIILESSGSQFDPAIVEAFLKREREFAELAAKLGDDPAPSADTSPTSALPRSPALEESAGASEGGPANGAGG
ncbi:MAG: response regulator [Phycisphaerae bacterium]|nr:response regulator [Phycisphaerae bacterium]